MPLATTSTYTSLKMMDLLQDVMNGDISLSTNDNPVFMNKYVFSEILFPIESYIPDLNHLPFRTE